MARQRRKLLFLVNDDAFFVSHRLALGQAARDHGCEVIVAASASQASARIENEGIRFVPLRFDRGGRSLTRDARTLQKIIDLYRREEPYLVHHVTIKPVLYGSTAARIVGVPSIVNAVSGLGYVFIEGPNDGRSRQVLRRAVKAAYRFALGAHQSRTIFQNPDDRSYFIENNLVAPARTLLIPGSGVDVQRFAATPLPPETTTPLVVLPARLLWDKGVGEFVEAARRLRQQGCQAKFVLVGSADSTNPARIEERQIHAWQREGIVEWWGHRDHMESIYQQAHVVVLPSYREGLPLALVEASSCGRACITTDVPGCREIVRDGVTGWLVPARDTAALAATLGAALADQPELRRRGAQGAQRVREGFSKDVVVAHHLKLYETLGLLGPAPRASRQP